MASSGSVFSKTLQSITNTKLEELAKQRVAFEGQYSALLEAARAKQDPLDRLSFLVDGTKTCLGVKTTTRKTKDRKLGQVISGDTSNPRLETDLKNLDRFLEQARYDPSVSPKVLQDWERSILQYLAVQSTKYQYADLYGKLVTEWLSSEKKEASDGDVEMGDSFEELPTAKKMQARTEWEKIVFEPAEIDIGGLKQYLQRLFESSSNHPSTSDQKKENFKALKDLQYKVYLFESSMAGSTQFNVPTLVWVIQGLQSSDLLTNEKREVLKDFLSNNVILGEIADVLNMRMASLARWTWGEHVPLEQRRKLNGSYSVHMHEDLLQAIFLHYIGVKWSVFFKSTFLDFRKNKKAWKSNRTDLSKTDRQRREYYLGDDATYPGLQNERSKTQRKTYFMHQLLDHQSQRVVVQEGEEEAEFGDFVQDDEEYSGRPHKRRQGMMVNSAMGQNPSQAVPQQPMYQQQQMYQQQMQQQQQMDRRSAPRQRLAQHAARQSWTGATGQAYLDLGEENISDDDNLNSRGPKKPIEAKQDLLHLLSTEIIVNTALHGELTCFRSVFESFNPLLPHDAVLTVLEFFGVSEKWRTFFKTFLQAPLKFSDDESAEPRLRRRGTPGSHSLSDVFGEVTLFCLDFSINQTTDGSFLYRLYDDFWFWSHDYENCVKAWSATLEFTKATGTQLSSSKTGTVRVSNTEGKMIDDRLPKGQIRWGFLYLDRSSGRFEIDRKMVDSHVEELRKQLQGKSKSVIDWIQVWNTYAATFFSSNFGKAANCFGRGHVDRMLATHRHIQEAIFDGGNVVQFLKTIIEERFGVQEIPDGFLFFPVELGGLDLKSPFVGLLQIREAVVENPDELMDEFAEAEKDDYMNFKIAFDNGNTIRSRTPDNRQPVWKPDENADEFFPFHEYVKYREDLSLDHKAELVHVYRELLERPTEQGIDISERVRLSLGHLAGQHNLRGITGNWNSMDAYWKWVAQMYGPEMVERFGGLNVVDPGLLPIGMVGMFRERRTKWQG